MVTLPEAMRRMRSGTFTFRPNRKRYRYYRRPRPDNSRLPVQMPSPKRLNRYLLLRAGVLVEA